MLCCYTYKLKTGHLPDTPPPILENNERKQLLYVDYFE